MSTCRTIRHLVVMAVGWPAFSAMLSLSLVSSPAAEARDQVQVQVTSSSFALPPLQTNKISAPAKVFLLDIENRGVSKRCTATFLDLRSSHHLITNAHCFDGPLAITLHVPAQVNVTLNAWFGQSPTAHDYSLRLKNLDRSRDLAELEIPPAFETEFGRSISSIEAATPPSNLSDSYASLGFHGGRAGVAFTRGETWGDTGNGLTTVHPVITSLENIAALWNLEHHQMRDGYSGGPTVNQNNELLGISLRFKAFVESTQVIPTADVIAFLGEPAWIHADVLDLTQGEGESAQWINAGENSGAHGGENSGAHGGENSGAHGGQSSPTRAQPNAQPPIVPGGTHGDLRQHRPSQKPIDAADKLAPFREPEEGIDIKTAEGVQHLLAVGDSKSAFQIDGFDDKRLRNPLLKTKHSFELYRGTKLYAKAQHSILKRFLGRYYDMTFSSGVKVYMRNKQTNEFEPFMQGEPTTVLEFTRQHDDLQLTLGISNFSYRIIDQDFRIQLYGDARLAKLAHVFGQGDVKQAGEEAKYIFTLSKDAQTLSVKSQSGLTLKCDNTNFLKLICSARTPEVAEDLSISLSSINDPANEVLTFHHAMTKLIPFKGVPTETIIFRYGTLRRQQ